MKKIYTLISGLLITSATFAQSLVPLNATSIVYGTSSDAQLQATIQIENTSANALDIGCERIELSVVSGSENNFCWGPLCYPSTTSISVLPETINPGDINTSFIGDYQPHHGTGITSIDYKFFDTNNITDFITVNIQYDTQTLGIDNPNANTNFLNVASRPGNSLIAVSYNVAGSSKGQLKIYNVLGNHVKSLSLSNNGTMVISTSGMAKGVYVFCLEANGKTVATKKFVVSK